jgi:hypothetical protein
MEGNSMMSYGTRGVGAMSAHTYTTVRAGDGVGYDVLRHGVVIGHLYLFPTGYGDWTFGAYAKRPSARTRQRLVAALKEEA